MAACEIHPFDPAVGECRTCGTGYCAECLVYPYGSQRPPLCVECALAIAGVRRVRRRPSVRT